MRPISDADMERMFGSLRPERAAVIRYKDGEATAEDLELLKGRSEEGLAALYLLAVHDLTSLRIDPDDDW